MNSERRYRCIAGGGRFKTFTITVKESDLWIAVPHKNFHASLPAEVEQQLWRARRRIETYIAAHPEFSITLEPYLLQGPAPEIVLEMIRAGNMCGVGPMAAVAGVIADHVGKWLLRRSPEVIVENGGDIFVKNVEAVKVAILAGTSPLSGKIALLVEPGEEPWGVSTASGTVGHSFSKGRADAAVVLATSAALADAAATSVGNIVQGAADFAQSLDLARRIEGVIGAAVICGDEMALWGRIRIQPLHHES